MLNKTNNPHYDFPIEMVRLNAIGQTQDNGLPSLYQVPTDMARALVVG